MIKKVILLALWTASSVAMQTTEETYSTSLLDENSRCSRSTSAEDFFADMEQVAALNQKHQEDHWQSRLRDIQDAQLSTDNKVAAGKLIPQFLAAVKAGSEQEWGEQYHAAVKSALINQELLKQIKPGASRSSKKVGLLETPRHPIISIIRIVQRRDNTLPPYTDFCIDSEISGFWLSHQGDRLTIATEDKQLHIWSLNPTFAKPAWCTTTKTLEDPIQPIKSRSCGQKIVEIVMGIFFPSRDL